MFADGSWGWGWAAKSDFTLGVIRCARKAGEFPVVTYGPKVIAHLLRSIANGATAQAQGHDMIFKAAADLLERVPAQGAPEPEGFMLLPVEATAMMALRGYQTTGIFEKNDYFGDYIDAAELPAALAPTHKFDDDERGWMLAAAAYRGCVAGYIETLRRLEKDPADAIALGWTKPMNSAVTSTERKTDGS